MSTDGVLVIAPHPDDETLGAGGTMARCAKAGQKVHGPDRRRPHAAAL